MKNEWIGTSYHDDVIRLPYDELVKELVSQRIHTVMNILTNLSKNGNL